MVDLVPEEAIEQAAYRLAGKFRGDEGQWRGYTEAAEVAVAAAAPLIVAADRRRMLPELLWLFEHAVDYDVPGALRDIVAGTWSLANAKAADLRASVLRGEGQDGGSDLCTTDECPAAPRCSSGATVWHTKTTACSGGEGDPK